MPEPTANQDVAVFHSEGPARYARNLEALRRAQPSVAAVLEQTTVPAGVRSAIGRDGSLAVQFVGSDGRPRWFGGSSMPSVSSEEMFCTARADAGNVSIPGILTGAEPLVILRRTPFFRALFVIEKEPARLLLAMHLYDYSEFIDASRLIFILDDDLLSRLLEYFEAHPASELPAQMFTVPQNGPAATAELQRRLEQAGEAVVRLQARLVESQSRRLRRRSSCSIPGAPRTAVLTLDPGAAAAHEVRRIQAALAGLGWPSRTSMPSAPDQCHSLARVQAVADVEADWVLAVQGTGAALRTALPDTLPVVTWLIPDAPLPRQLDCDGPGDVIVTAKQSERDRIVAGGIDASRVLRLAPSVDEGYWRCAGQSGARPPLDAAVLMDVTDDRPESSGITLPSHVALWREIRAIARCAVDGPSGTSAESVLGRAEEICGVRLSEAAGRRHMLELVENRVIPAAVADATARALDSARLKFDVWGDCSIVRGGTNAGPIPWGDRLRAAVDSARFAVFPLPTPAAIQAMLGAVARDVSVFLRTSAAWFTREYPDLDAFLPAIRFYRRTSELLSATQVLAPPSQRCDLRVLLAEHTMAARLTTLRTTCRI